MGEVKVKIIDKNCDSVCSTMDKPPYTSKVEIGSSISFIFDLWVVQHTLFSLGNIPG